jgi:ligand-binding SRPBCC domain-containing protein
MKIYTHRSSQFVPASLDVCWEFFSAPANLAKITPPSMEFRIISDPEPEMYAGQIITYTVKPLPFMRTTWVTEISQVKNKAFFIDEQRFGPYRFWHHKHFFRQVENGVEMTDIVHYVLPMGFLGRIAISFVRKQLSQIFEFRKARVEELFPSR